MAEIVDVPERATDSPDLRHKNRTGNTGKLAQSNMLSGEIFGQAAWLLSRSPNHKHLFLSDLEWLLIPPLSLRQFRLILSRKRSIALALWASVSKDVEKDLLAGRTRLRPAEWNSGERLWLIELIGPGLTDAAMKGVIGEIARHCFDGRKFKMRIKDSETGGTRVVRIEAGKKETHEQVLSHDRAELVT